jgi:addiction module RelB/DinJ family antitoxin
MSKTVTVQARMKPELKQKADIILAALGMNATTAITIFYTQLVRQGGIPLELKLPSDELIAAIDELKDPAFRETTEKFGSVDALMADLMS